MIDILTLAGVILGALAYTLIGYFRSTDGTNFDWKYVLTTLIPLLFATFMQILTLAPTITVAGGFIGGFVFGVTGKWATDIALAFKRFEK